MLGVLAGSPTLSSTLRCRVYLSSCMINVGRKFSGKVYDHHRQYEDEEHKEWFAKSDVLTKARENSPHIVYLEGPPGSGKKDVLARLAKLGYTTSSSDFMSSLSDTGLSLPEAEGEHLLELTGFVDLVKTNADKPNYFKENIVFRNRSLISMSRYFNKPQKAREALHSLYPNFSIIMCKADPTVRMQRVGLRQYYATENSSKVIQLLKEDDQEYLDTIAETYNKYLATNEEKIFDDSVFTTSVKQGAAAILSLYGIKAKTITEIQEELKICR